MISWELEEIRHVVAPRSIPSLAVPVRQDGWIVVAFLVEGPSAAMFGMFQRSVIRTASQSEWDDKIRDAAGCPDAEVRIIQPSEWNPPALSEVSQQELGNKYPLILSRMTDYVLANRLPITPDKLVNGGNVVFNPVSGKVFFAYKL